MSAVRKVSETRAPAGERRPSKREHYQWLESDGEPLETSWHPLQIFLFLDMLEHRWHDRDDFYIGGNMFLYYALEQARHILKTQGRTTRFKGPDFFYVRGVPRFPPRPYWVVWDEGNRYPDLIIELLSRTTAKTDRTTKKELYERTFRTPEYFLYDFEGPLLEGWRLGARKRYQKIRSDPRGWLWSEQLGLWLGTWRGRFLEVEKDWLRCYDEEGRLVLTWGEASLQRAEAEAQRAETQAQRAQATAQRAEIEKQRADTERQRAEAAEAELARLKTRLAELEGKKTPGKGSRS